MKRTRGSAVEDRDGSNGTVAALFPNTEDQRNNLVWNAIPDVVRPAWLIPKTG